MRRDRDPASLSQIAIVPSAAEYAEQMEILTGIVYRVNPRDHEDVLNADHFRHHLEVFPEGQFVAVDRQTERVVGLTACMRFDYDPARRPLEPWWAVIGYG